jgi:salicylate hydroxylase
VGAGIQIPSNSSRILLSWGLGEFFGSKVVQPEGMSFLRWQDGTKIGYTKLVPDFQENFGAPYYVVHRADFHDALYRCAIKLGVTLHVDSRVVSYDAVSATVRTANDLSYSGDLVIAADGKAEFMNGDYGNANPRRGQISWPTSNPRWGR